MGRVVDPVVLEQTPEGRVLTVAARVVTAPGKDGGEGRDGGIREMMGDFARLQMDHLLFGKDGIELAQALQSSDRGEVQVEGYLAGDNGVDVPRGRYPRRMEKNRLGELRQWASTLTRVEPVRARTALTAAGQSKRATSSKR